tara:strand:+ start:4898 stop:6085 length:1188 start_codon:yes stop_codon:yes gene_type:complete
MAKEDNFFYKYFLVFLTILVSGVPVIEYYFNDFYKDLFLIGILIINFFFCINKKINLIKSDILFFIIFLILITFHFLKYENLILVASLGFLINMTIAFLNIKNIKNFSKIYIKIIYYISLISLFFYFLYIVTEFKFGIQLNAISTHNFFYHYKLEGLNYFRNSGPFWEPGAFAGYLVLALFLILRDFNKIDKKIFLFISLTLITTLSTTGYIAYFLILIILLLKKKIIYFDNKRFYGPIFILIIIFFLGMYFYNEFDFLKNKINLQIEASQYQLKNYQSNRIGNFLYDLQFIKINPFYGLSANIDIRNLYDPLASDIIFNQGNALSGFTVRFGLIGIFTVLTFFCYAVFKSTKSYPITFVSLMLLCCLLFSEKYLNFPLFFTLFFLRADLNKEDI